MKFGDHDHVLLFKIEPRSLMAAVCDVIYKFPTISTGL